MANWLSFIGGILDPVGKIIDDVITSDEERLQVQAKLEETKKELAIRAMESWDKVVDARAKIITAEAQGGFLQRNWRPLLMLTAIVIIFNNYVVVPYASIWFPDHVRVLELPGGLWGLLTTGTAGYVLGRSGEKIAKTIKSGGSPNA